MKNQPPIEEVREGVEGHRSAPCTLRSGANRPGALCPGAAQNGPCAPWGADALRPANENAEDDDAGASEDNGPLHEAVFEIGQLGVKVVVRHKLALSVADGRCDGFRLGAFHARVFKLAGGGEGIEGARVHAGALGAWEIPHFDITRLRMIGAPCRLAPLHPGALASVRARARGSTIEARQNQAMAGIGILVNGSDGSDVRRSEPATVTYSAPVEPLPARYAVVQDVRLRAGHRHLARESLDLPVPQNHRKAGFGPGFASRMIRSVNTAFVSLR